MTALRSRRLEALFGGPLDDLKGEHFRQLVPNGVTEEFDLDFKQTTYGNADKDKRDLCGDVAALANTAGGVILLGVAEDDQARATATPGVALTDTEVARMRQIVASGVSPMPHVDILQVPDDDADPTHGYFVIAVPRSPDAPHAVLLGTSVRFPKRNGATTRYLSEPEIAAAYRDRATGAAAQQRRIDVVEADAIGRLDMKPYPWLVVSLLPDLTGDMLLSSQAFQDFSTQVQGKSAGFEQNAGLYFMRTSVGRRRLLADGGGQTPSAEYASLELHTDGSGAFAIGLIDMERRQRQQTDPGAPPANLVSDEGLVRGIISGFGWLARHAVHRCAAGGNALVRARLIHQDGARSIEVGHSRFYGFGESLSKVALSGELAPAETVAALDDLVLPSQGMTVAVAALANELGQPFGIPELGQFTASGELRPGKSKDGQAMVQWASQHGIPVAQ